MYGDWEGVRRTLWEMALRLARPWRRTVLGKEAMRAHGPVAVVPGGS